MAVDNRLLEYNGETKTYAEWAKRIGITADTLYRRLDIYFWDIERALTTPNVHKKTYNGKTLRQWEKETGIERHTLWRRFNVGKRKGDYLRPVANQPKSYYPELIYGYHREKLHNKKKRCCHPDCFHCPYKDCRMP